MNRVTLLEKLFIVLQFLSASWRALLWQFSISLWKGKECELKLLVYKIRICHKLYIYIFLLHIILIISKWDDPPSATLETLQASAQGFCTWCHRHGGRQCCQIGQVIWPNLATLAEAYLYYWSFAVLFQSAAKSSAALEHQKWLRKCSLCGRYRITRSIKELNYSKLFDSENIYLLIVFRMLTFIVTPFFGSLCCTDRAARQRELFNACILLVTLKMHPWPIMHMY